MKYVAGFLFNEDLSRVAMVRKNKPEWQAGLLNGIGGKVESSDADSHAAMVREFDEETGYNTHTSEWSYFAIIGTSSWSVDFFAGRGDLTKLRTVESEPIEIIECATILQQRVIENIPWLLALAIDHLQDGRPAFSKIEYPS